jgi:hypothetical protein
LSASKQPKIGVSARQEEDSYWLNFGKTLISNTIKTFDERAQFMITTCASLITADFAILSFTSKFNILTISPQFFFSLSALCFISSLFPKKYVINPWQPNLVKARYNEIIGKKSTRHIIGFGLFFIGLIAIAISSISFI